MSFVLTLRYQTMSDGYAHCPECKCWVPSDDMVYDYDDDGRLLKVCLYCLGEKELPYNPALGRKGFVLDEHYGQVQCLYCDSWNTEEYDPIKYPENGSWGLYHCMECGEFFRRILE